jgi:hypothetical protein
MCHDISVDKNYSFKNSIQSVLGKSITLSYLNYKIPALPHSDVLPVLRH